MKIFLVIYVHGLIGGVIGPLGGNISICQSYASELSQITKEEQERLKTNYDIKYSCEEHEKAPDINQFFGVMIKPGIEV